MSSEKLEFEQLPSADPEIHVYRLRGPLVLGNMFEFQNVLRADSASTILDLTEVPYIDSAGLGIVINSYVAHQKSGRKLLLVGANERVTTLFKVTRMDNVFEVYPTIEEATSALTNAAA